MNFEAMPSMDAPKETIEEEKKPYTAEELARITGQIKDSTSGFWGGEVKKAEKAIRAYGEEEANPTETLESIARGMKRTCDLEDMGRLDPDRIPEGEEKTKELTEDAIAQLAQIREGRDTVIERNPAAYKELMESFLKKLEDDVLAGKAREQEYFEGLRALGNEEYLTKAIGMLREKEQELAKSTAVTITMRGSKFTGESSTSAESDQGIAEEVGRHAGILEKALEKLKK